MPFIEDSLKKFNDLDPEMVLTVDSDEVSAAVEKIAQKYKIDFGILSSLLIFLAVGDLEEEEAPEYLRGKLDIGGAMAGEIFKSLQENVTAPLKKRLDFLNADPNKLLALTEEKEILLNLFGKRLLRELNKHPFIANAVNGRIFYVLSRDIAFKDELVKALLANGEKVSSKDFFLDKKPSFPSVANWIQSFIKEYGSNLFDSVILSKFLADSKNVKSLDEKEKELARKVLLVYRNLKFFPESMSNDTGEDWQILPFPLPAEISGGEVAEKEKLSAPENFIPPRKEETKIEDNGEKERQKRLAELGEAAEKYRAGSLERKAIEEEIKKIKT